MITLLLTNLFFYGNMYLRGENMNGFGKRLVEARERKGYNQKQFAEILGITPTRLNYWEKDKREPDFFMFSKIITLLEEDANKLLGIQSHADEGIQMYNQLDDIDQAEIRGEMRHMLKAPKYNKSSISEDIAKDFKKIVDSKINTKSE